MLARRARVSPCRARCSFSPLGPFTVTVCPASLTSTPLGTGTGSFPTLDIVFSALPDQGHQLTADTPLTSGAVGEQPVRGGEDRHPEPVADPRNLPYPDIMPPTGTRYAFQVADDGLAVVV